jgi:hypothetical protein
MKAKQLPIDFHEWVKARTFAIDAGIASRVHLQGTIRNAFKEGNVVDWSEKTWHGRN